MSAAVCLWRRAPVWRALLLLATATSVLTTVYAPRPQPQPVRAVSSYASPTPPTLLDKVHNGLVVVADRAIPLPSLGWSTIVTATQPMEPRVESEVLAQVRDGRVTGLILAQGTTSPSTAAGKLPYRSTCTLAYVYRIWTVLGAGGMHECWAVAPVVISSPSPQQSRSIIEAALDRLRSAGLELPPVMVAAGWDRQDATSTAIVTYFFDPAVDRLAPRQADAWKAAAVSGEPDALHFIQRVAAWCERWTPLLERGAAGALTRQEVVTALTSEDPNVYK